MKPIVFFFLRPRDGRYRRRTSERTFILKLINQINKIAMHFAVRSVGRFFKSFFVFFLRPREGRYHT